MRAYLAVVALFSIAALWATAAAAHEGSIPRVSVDARGDKLEPLSLSFGIYQSYNASEMYRNFTPIIEVIQDDVERRLGRSTDIQMRIFKTYEEGIEALVSGKVDFVRFGPAPYILSKRKNDALELIAMELEDGKKQFNGCIVVPRESKIHALSDLRGKSFAFGDRNSTIGRYLVQDNLVQAGIRAVDLSRYDYLDRHDKVAAAVLAGDFDAGAVKEANLEESKGQLRAVLTFQNVTKPWVARSGLDPLVGGALRSALLELRDAGALKTLKVSGFSTTSDAEYRAVRLSMQAAEAFDPLPSGK
jgi:phosphonate transport system substrate-binding protein